MNRNILNDENFLNTIITISQKKNCKTEVQNFFKELLTESEIETLSKRWRILELLSEGSTQRDIAKELGVSLCKVTRGAKILKNDKSVLTKYFIKEIKNGNKLKNK